MKAAYHIQTSGGNKITVTGDVQEGAVFAIRKCKGEKHDEYSRGEYSLDHIPTGATMGRFPRKKDARAFMERLRPSDAGWKTPDIHQLRQDMYSLAQAARDL